MLLGIICSEEKFAAVLMRDAVVSFAPKWTGTFPQKIRPDDSNKLHEKQPGSSF